MGRRNVIVIGASAGGVEALRELALELPPFLPASIFAVVHTSPGGPSLLAGVLDRAGPLPALPASDGGRFEPGHIYVGVPDYHLLVEAQQMKLWRGPRENRARPAVDPLFRSAARAHRKRVIGVVLSGGQDDGTAGLMAIKAWGGVAIVQDPTEAVAPSMPRSALENVPVDYRLPLSSIPDTLERLVHTEVESVETTAPVAESAPEGNRDEEDRAAEPALESRSANPEPGAGGRPSGFGCPACGGVLWEVNEESGWFRFRCRVGHAYAPKSLVLDQERHLEDTLWSAVRELEEMGELKRRLAKHELSSRSESARLEEEAAHALERAAHLRAMLTNGAARKRPN